MFQLAAMPTLNESELRFEIRRAVQSLPRGVIRDLIGKPDAYERGLRSAVEIVYQRFALFDVIAPEQETQRWDFGAMKNR